VVLQPQTKRRTVLPGLGKQGKYGEPGQNQAPSAREARFFPNHRGRKQHEERAIGLTTVPTAKKAAIPMRHRRRTDQEDLRDGPRPKKQKVGKSMGGQ